MVAIDQSSHILVFARGDDNDSCARPTVGDNGDVLSIGITTHTLLKILSAVFLGLTLLNSIIHITRHLARYTAPSQQRQIIRIILVPTVFAIFSFLSVFFYQTSIYLRPLAEIYESIAIPAIFILYVHYVFPGSHSWRELFYRLEDPHSRESGIAGGDVTWFKRTCVLVFQYVRHTQSFITFANPAALQIPDSKDSFFNCGNRYARRWSVLCQFAGSAPCASLVRDHKYSGNFVGCTACHSFRAPNEGTY